MFCENCGRRIPDGQTNCPVCAPQAAPPQPPVAQPVYQQPMMYQPPVEQPVYQQPVYQQPVYQQPVYEPPVEQPLYQQPVYQQPVYQQPVYEAPVEQPVQESPAAEPQVAYTEPDAFELPPQEPAFTVGVPQDAPPAKKKRNPRKKGNGGKIALAVTALVLVAAVVLALFNWASVKSFFRRTFSDPGTYLQTVEKENMETLVTDLTGTYDSLREALTASAGITDAAGSAKLTLEVSDTLTDMLEPLLAQTNLDISLDWVDSISLDIAANVKGQAMAYDVGVGLNGVDVATVSLILDLENMKLWIGVPELNKTYISMDLGQMANVDPSQVAAIMAQQQELMAELQKALPTGAELGELINTYWAVVTEALGEAEKETEAVEVDGVEQKLTKLTVDLSARDLAQILVDVVKKASKDDRIEKILNDFSQIASLLSGESIDLYSEFEQIAEFFLAGAEENIQDLDRKKLVTLETFLDGKDVIVGRNLEIEVEDQEVSIHYVTVRDGDSFAFEAEMEAQGASAEITGKGTEKDGKVTASYDLYLPMVQGSLVTLELKDFDGQTGIIRIRPTAALLEMADLPTAVATLLESCALELSLKENGMRFGLELSGKDFAAIALESSTGKASAITFPEGVDANDNAGGQKWLQSLTFDEVLANLKKAKVPAEYTQMIEQLTEMLKRLG